MSKAEDAALKAYPPEMIYGESTLDGKYDGNTTPRYYYIKGYEQAEKDLGMSYPLPEDTVLFQKGVEEGRRLEKDDLALTWEDMATIDSLITEVSNSYVVGNYDHDGEREHFYGEVLRRFKETKDGQVHQATEE